MLVQLLLTAWLFWGALCALVVAVVAHFQLPLPRLVPLCLIYSAALVLAGLLTLTGSLWLLCLTALTISFAVIATVRSWAAAGRGGAPERD